MQNLGVRKIVTLVLVGMFVVMGLIGMVVGKEIPVVVVGLVTTVVGYYFGKSTALDNPMPKEKTKGGGIIWT